MAIFNEPSINWARFDDVQMKVLADTFKAFGNGAAVFLESAAKYIEPAIENSLKEYGLDGTNRLGFGSDAKKTAKRVTGLWLQAGGHLKDAGGLMGHSYSVFMRDVWNPIAVAKQQQKMPMSSKLNV